MQPYYAIKLKCFFLRLLAGSTILLTAAGIIIAVLQEMIGNYDSNSKLAYVFGILICAVMIVIGIILVYQAFHFERFVFGRSAKNYALLKADMEARGVVSAGNLVATEQYVLLFSMNLLNMCHVIQTANIIACFENPVYGTVAKPTEYTLYIYDRDFKCHTIVMDAGQTEAGHMAMEKICEGRPWIINDNQDTFLDEIMTKSGRRGISRRMDKKIYQMNSTVDVDAEAEIELSELENEAKQKLDFKSLLNKKKKK